MLRSCLLLFAVLAFAGPAAAASSDEGAAPADPAFETMMSRGDVLLAGGDDAGAEQAFRAALQLGPGGAARADAFGCSGTDRACCKTIRIHRRGYVADFSAKPGK